MPRCATRSRTSPPRSGRSSRPTSPTSTGRSSPSSTCRRPSRGRFLPAIRGIPGPCAGSTWRSSRPTPRLAARPFDGAEGERAAGALRARLPRLRRRLDRPGRRRPRRLRVGLQRAHQGAAARPARRLPRAVDPLHPLRQADADDAGGGYRYYRDDELGPEFGAAMDELFSIYSRSLSRVEAWAAERWPRGEGEPEGAWRRSIRAKALDLLRGLLPAATLSHVGIYASGQAYEQLMLRLMASPLPEAREYGGMILAELQQVMPSFVSRVERPDRGGEWISYLQQRRERTEQWVSRLGLDRRGAGEDAPSVELIHVDGSEEDLLAACLFEAGRGARDRDPRPHRRPRPRRAGRAAGGDGRRARQPPPPPRPRLRGAALPLRDRLRLRRLPRPAAPPDADLPVAAPRPRPRRRRPRRGARSGRRRRVRTGPGDLARRVRAARRGRAAPSRRPTRSASPTGSATRSTSTPARRCT